MARWRDIKKGKTTQTKKQKHTNTNDKIYIVCTSPLDRIKAFITDMFMIMMPIMYITTYIILDGKDAFQGSQTARWVTMAIYGIITVIFWVKKGQTPGLKAYDLHLIDDNTRRPLTPMLAIGRYILFIFSAVAIVPSLLPFFRKDKKTFQDLLMQTSVIKIER
jgi:uncharacterized RDD family membrane protein YckC